MKKFLNIIVAALFIISISSSVIYAKMTKEQMQKEAEEAASNLTDEQKAQIESAAYQIAYKVMDTAIVKSLKIIDKVNIKLDSTTQQIPEETKAMIEQQLSDLEKLLQEEQSKLENATTLEDLKVIQEDLVAGLMENAKETQLIFLAKADEVIAQAETALKALEVTCGVDVSEQEAQLNELSVKLDEYEEALQSGETMTSEELKTTMQKIDPKEIQAELQSLASDMQELQTSCPTQQ